MNDNYLSNVMVIIIFIAGIIWVLTNGGKYEGETAEYWFNAYDEVQAENDDLRYAIDEYSTALNEANDNIDYANSMISDVQYSSTVYELSSAIGNLSSIDNVDAPY
ncbi:MAG: hypothetical protein ACEQSA_01105 [Weeksellaceae bacterium]